MDFLNKQIDSRENVYEAAEGYKHFDVEQLERLDQALASIPLQTLPSTLVTPMMILGATVRQYRSKVEQVLRVHRTMDAENFEDFFRTLEEMKASLEATCADIDADVKCLREQPSLTEAQQIAARDRAKRGA